MNKYQQRYKELLEFTDDALVHFEDMAKFRIKKEQVKMVKKIVHKDSETYDNASHFYRCAAIKLIREERKRLKL